MLTLLLLISLTLSQFLHLVIQVVALAVFRVPITRISLYLGPKLWSWTWGRTLIVLRPIPIGVFTELDNDIFQSLPRTFRVLLILVAPVVLLMVGYLLTFADPLQIGLFLGQGLLHPVHVGAPLLHAFRDRFHHGVAFPFGCLLIAQSLVDLSPLPSCSGGRALAMLAQVPPRVMSVLEAASLVLLLVLFGSALVAYGSA